MSTAAQRRAAAEARRAAAQSAPAPEPAPPLAVCERCGAPVVHARTRASRDVVLEPALLRGVPAHQAPEGRSTVALTTEDGTVVAVALHDEGAVEGRRTHRCSSAPGEPEQAEQAEQAEPKPQQRRPRAPRPAERRLSLPVVSALPPEPLDEGALLCDQPQPLEPAGTRCWVATTPQGPACTVQLDDGRLVHGYRVPEGWTRRDDLTLVYVGRCVAAVWVDAVGRWLTDELGHAVLGPAIGGGVTLHREALASDQLVVVDAVPPPIAGRTP